MIHEENPPSRRLWGQHGMRISPNPQLLCMIGDGFTYRGIAEIFGIRRETAIRWVTEARREFAERHNLPLETLHLDKRPPGRKPELSGEEQRLLSDLIKEKWGRPSKLESAYEEWLTSTATRLLSNGLEALPSDEPNTRRQWMQDVEQSRHTPSKRQR
jgi:transposase